MSETIKKGSVEETMGEFKRGKLHSGSKSGPAVKDRKQAVAIALNQTSESNKKAEKVRKPETKISFDQAVATARQHIPIAQSVTKPEYQKGFMIVRHLDGSHHVYDASAWDKPSQTPLLPWSPPQGERIAHVDMSGNVNMLTRPVTKRDPAAPAPTPKPPKVGSLPKPPKPPKPKATQAGVSVTSVTMKVEPTGSGSWPAYQKEFNSHAWQKHGKLLKDLDKEQGLRVLNMWADKKPAHEAVHAILGSEPTRDDSQYWKRNEKSEPTAILDAARVDAEVERRLAEIEGAREDLQKGLHPENKLRYAEEKATNSSQIARDSNDPTHHDNAAFWSRKAAKVAREQGKEALAGYHESVAKFHESKGTGQQPIAKSESDHVKEFVLGLDLGGTRRWHSACVSKDDSNLGKAIKGKQADRTYSREGSRGVPGICTGCGGELQMDPAPREVDAPVHGEDHNEHKIEKGEKMSSEEVRGHLQQLQQRADEHQKAGRKADADAMREKIKIIKEKHGMGPGGKSASRLNKAFYKEPGQGRYENVVFQQGDDADEALQIADAQGEEAAVKHLMQWHNPGEHETSDESSAGEDDFTFESEHHPGYILSYRPSRRYIGLEFDTHKGIAKSELLAGARHHYARVVRFQQLGKSEEVAKSAAMCALYVTKMGADPSKDVPAEVRNCGPVDLQKASFHLDREVRGLPAKMLPLIKSSRTPETAEQFEEKHRISPEQHQKLIGAGFNLPQGWSHEKGSKIQAPISWKGDYVISHRGDESDFGGGHNVSYRPTGQHHHVGRYPTAQEAFRAADTHASRQGSPVKKTLTGAPGDTAPGATMDGGALQLAEDAKHGAKSDVIGEVGKGGGKPLDIGDGYHVHAHGFDDNGNHSIWVSKGSGRARKIQSGQNLPSVHSQRGAGEKKGHLPITKKIAEEIKDYHRKYHEKPVKKTEPCAPAGSPLEKLNAMIKGAGGASLSKAARAPRPPQEHNG